MEEDESVWLVLAGGEVVAACLTEAEARTLRRMMGHGDVVEVPLVRVGTKR